jgi:hypothetical protein
METPEDRQARLRQLADAIEFQLEPGWVYVLVVGKPGDAQSVNLVSNAPTEMADQIIQGMADRCANPATRPRSL